MPSTDQKASDHWTLDKKIPIALVVLIVGQIGAGIWFARGMDSRITQLEVNDARILLERDARRKLVDDKLEASARDRERLARIEVQTDFLVRGIQRIEQKLDNVREQK
jgi:hypothetical protein